MRIDRVKELVVKDVLREDDVLREEDAEQLMYEEDEETNNVQHVQQRPIKHNNHTNHNNNNNNKNNGQMSASDLALLRSLSVSRKLNVKFSKVF